MAKLTLDNFIKTMNVVATAYNKVNSFKYDEIWNINGNLNVEFPCIWVHCNPDYTVTTVGNKFTQVKDKFEFKVAIFDAYTIQEQKAINDDSEEFKSKKQEELIVYMRQYLAEVKRICLEDYQTDVVLLDGFVAGFNKHNQKLAEHFQKIQVQIVNNCDLGTFTYV